MIKLPSKLLNELTKNRQANHVISILNELLLSSTKFTGDLGGFSVDDKSVIDLSFSDII